MSETNNHSFVPFPDVRNCALGLPRNPKRDSDLALNPHTVASPLNQASYWKKPNSGYFQRKEKKKEIWLPLSDREKKAAHRRQIGGPSSQTDTEGHFNPLLKKRRRNSEKAVSHKLIHPVLHPYLNSSVHFAQFSADPDNIPNMTRSWINSSPRYVAERKRHFYRIEFFLSSKFGKWSHHCWEGWEGSCVSPKSPAFKKAGYCPREISRENNWVFAPLLCFSARKYLQDGCLRCAQPLLCSHAVE